MGHMWYGCVITNSWWNQTWLKEAWADFLGFYSYRSAYNSLKPESQKKLIHPILLIMQRKVKGLFPDCYSESGWELVFFFKKNIEKKLPLILK